jgi:proline iminopeptidase
MIILKKMFVSIPERNGVSATKLYVQIVAEDEVSLQSKPYAFMLSGGPGLNHSHYKDYSCLQDVANVVFIDPRGCGLSDKGDSSTYTMDVNIDDLDVIRQHLNLDSINIVGKSYGGMCALGYAIRFPYHLKKLVVAAGAINHSFLNIARLNISKRDLNIDQLTFIERMWSGDFSTSEEMEKGLSCLKNLYSYKIRHGESTNRALPDYPIAPEPYNQGFKGFLNTFNFEDQLQNIKCPTLILVGEEDWITDKSHSVLMSEKIPNNRLIIFPKADHSMESDVPELYFQAIRDFIKD